MLYRTIVESLSSGRWEILITLIKIDEGTIIEWGSDPKEKNGLEKWEVISSEEEVTR